MILFCTLLIRFILCEKCSCSPGYSAQSKKINRTRGRDNCSKLPFLSYYLIEDSSIMQETHVYRDQFTGTNIFVFSYIVGLQNYFLKCCFWWGLKYTILKFKLKSYLSSNIYLPCFIIKVPLTEVLQDEVIRTEMDLAIIHKIVSSI